LAPSSDAPKARPDDFTKATRPSPAISKQLPWIPLRIVMISMLRKITPLSVQQSQVMWTSANHRPKKDILRYLIGLVVLTTSTGFD
jgi:hypothetical protein